MEPRITRITRITRIKAELGLLALDRQFREGFLLRVGVTPRGLRSSPAAATAMPAGEQGEFIAAAQPVRGQTRRCAGCEWDDDHHQPTGDPVERAEQPD